MLPVSEKEDFEVEKPNGSFENGFIKEEVNEKSPMMEQEGLYGKANGCEVGNGDVPKMEVRNAKSCTTDRTSSPRKDIKLVEKHLGANQDSADSGVGFLHSDMTAGSQSMNSRSTAVPSSPKKLKLQLPTGLTKDRHASGSSSSSSSSGDSSSDSSAVTPPDGGWGWVVVFGSFLCHMIADGCAFSFGVLFVELLEVFGESKGKTAWVGSLFVAMPLITGPIASAVVNRYGCRVTTIVGGVIASFGFVLSSQVNSIGELCVTFGIISGFGLSMVYVPGVVIVAYYFEKRRAFATGLAVAGSGIGTFLMAPLTELLINVYGWRGALLIIGGIMLNIVVCGMVFRPLISPKVERRRRRIKASMERFSRMCSKQNLDYIPGGATSQAEQLEKLLEVPVTHSLMLFPTYMQKEICALYPDILHKDNKNKTLHEILTEHDLLEKFYTTSQSMTDMSVDQLSDVDASKLGSTVTGVDEVTLASSLRVTDLENSSVWKEHATAAGSGTGNIKKVPRKRSRIIMPMKRKDIFYRGSLLKGGSVYQQRAAAGPRGGALVRSAMSASCPNIHVHYSEDDSSDDESPLACCCHSNRFSRRAKHVFREMMDVSILRSPVFVFFCFSTFLLYLSYDVPYVFTPDKAIEMGISEGEASFLVSIIGITSTVGQIFIGYLGDRPAVNTVLLYNLLTSVAGIVTIFVPWYGSYAALCAYCTAYGFFISANYTLTTIILVNLLGMDKLTNAYGIEMLAEGIANLLGPPLSGMLTDYYQSYDPAFIFNGIVILLSGVMLFAIPCLYRCDDYIDKPDDDDKGFHSIAQDVGEDDIAASPASVCGGEIDGEHRRAASLTLAPPEEATSIWGRPESSPLLTAAGVAGASPVSNGHAGVPFPIIEGTTNGVGKPLKTSVSFEDELFVNSESTV